MSEQHQSFSSITPMHEKDPVRLLTWGYILALAIIGLMSVSIHFMIDRIVAEQDSVATIISKSMNQTTLAQAIALRATTLVQRPNDDARQSLIAATAKMRDAHMQLVKQGLAEKTDFNTAPEVLINIYFDPPYDLNKKITGFLDHADALAAQKDDALTVGAPDYTYLMDQVEGPLGAALNASLYSYESSILEKISKLQSFQRMAVLVIVITLICEAFLIFMPLVSRVRRYAEELKRLTMTDLLTGIGNRRFFIFRGSQEMHRARRMRKELCLALIDLDRFKAVNDDYGHKSGDMVLQQFVQVIQKCMRHEDVFARLGGEEFAVLLPHTAIDDGINVIERMRLAVEATEFEIDRGLRTRITLSAGLTRVNLSHEDFEAAIVLADVAMYEAKRLGRNRVIYKEAENFFDEAVPPTNVVPLKPA